LSLYRYFVFLLLLLSSSLQAIEEANIGVLAFRSKEQTAKQWQPTADYLSRAIPGCHFKIIPLNYPELEDAVTKQKIAFVITNTGHYVILESLYGASRIATLMEHKGGKPITGFGSVIFTAATHSDINSLKDLKDKSFSVVDKDSLGGYMAPFGELKKAGVEQKDLSRLIFTGMPHDQVVQAVLSGAADAGAVRTEVLEGMAKEGAISLKDIKVLSAKSNPNFPFVHSTALYPEWPIAKMDNTPNELANKVVVALLGMPYENEAAKKGEYYGWTAPMDYQPVHELMKQLHLRPYDTAQEFDIQDVLRKYMEGLIVFGILISLVIGFGWRTLLLNATLSQEVSRRTEAENRLQEITDTIGEGIYAIDESGIITYTNPNAEKILEFSKEEMHGANAHKLFHHTKLNGENYHQHECNISKVISSGKIYSSDDELFWRKDGSSVAVSVTSSPIMQNDKVIGSVVAFQDVSARKVLEEQIRTSNQILYKVLNSIDADIHVIDIATYEVIFANSHSKYKFGDIVGGHCFTSLQGNKAPCDFCPLDGYDRKEIPLDTQMSWEHKNEINGIWYSYRETVTRWIDGRKVKIQVGFDISERKKLEENLEARVEEELAKRQLQTKILTQQSKMAAMGEMVGAIAHQWKQPLNALALIVQDIREAFREGELDEKYVNQSVKDSIELIRHMSKTVDDFRNFFRPDKTIESFSIANIIDQVLSILSAQLKEKGISVKITEDATNIEALGYPNEFKQVILNIINNAKDALLENKIENPLIEIEICNKNKRPAVCIKDNAGGIPQEFLERIFEPYFTTKSEEKGTGIGLSMSKTIIEESMQGSLSAANTDVGAAFTIVL